MDDDLVGSGNLNGDAGDLVHEHFVGEAQTHDQLAALLLGTVANAVDFQFLGEALLNALHHVVDQGTGQAMQGLVQMLLIRTVNDQLIALELQDHVGMEGVSQGTLGSLHGDDVAIGNGHRNVCRDNNRLLTNSRHLRNPPYQTNARTSPPMWFSRAFLSVITPLEVETMAMPRPLRTLGSPSAPA